MNYHDTAPSEGKGHWWSIPKRFAIGLRECLMESDLPLIGPLPVTSDEAIALACEVAFARMERAAFNSMYSMPDSRAAEYNTVRAKLLIDGPSLSLLRDMQRVTRELGGETTSPDPNAQ